MPSTRLTKDVLANHWHYHRMIYLVIALLTYFGMDMLFTVTAYRPPKERKLEVQMVSAYSDPEGMKIYADEAMETLPFVSPVEEVNFISLAYSGADDDMFGMQKYTVMLGAQEGDIYMVNRPLFEQLVGMGAAVPLDGYIESGVIDVGDRDLLNVTYPEYVEEGEPATGNHCVYGLQMAPMNKMLDESINYDNRDKYMLLIAFSKNQNNAAILMNYLMEALEAPLPEWLEAVPGTSEEAQTE